MLMESIGPSKALVVGNAVRFAEHAIGRAKEKVTLSKHVKLILEHANNLINRAKQIIIDKVGFCNVEQN